MTLNEAWIREVMSGQAMGLRSVVLRAVLRAISIPYGVVVRLRNAAFHTGWLRIHRVRIPVISIGNLTTGGTGKTPIVALTARTLIRHSARPAIVSRGYRANSGGTNDEHQVLSQLCPGVPHRQHADRVASVKMLADQNAADVIVMDDGFQHRRLHRDLNILLIDATNPFGFECLLPRGLLREPLSSVRRADLIILTRTDLVSREQLDQIRTVLDGFARQPAVPVLQIEFAPAQLMSITGQIVPLAEAAGKSAFLMCGIGNPGAFENTCRRAGLRIVGTSAFGDHHLYSTDDLQHVRQLALQHQAELIVTTQKDLVKLTESETDILALIIEAQFPQTDDQRIFEQHIRSIWPSDS